MITLPNEVINHLLKYVSTPSSDMMKPYIISYNKYTNWISNRFDCMSFPEYMSVNAQYLDFTSKRHIREKERVLKMFD